MRPDHPHHHDRRNATTIALLLVLVGAALALATVLTAEADAADPTWTTYNPDTCTITITPSGRSVFQVTVGGTVEVYDLEDHQPVTLDVDGQAWSVAVERAGQGFVTVATGDAISCGEGSTTTTTEPPTTTTEPPPTTTTTESPAPPRPRPRPPIDGCDDVECPPRGPTTTVEDTTTTTGDDAVPVPSSPPSPGGPTDTLPMTGPAESLRPAAVLGVLLLGVGGLIGFAEWRTRKVEG